MKKISVLFLISLLVLCTAGLATTIDGVVMVPKAKVAPVIDGEMDPIWKNVTEEKVDLWESADPDDDYDLSAAFRMLWDDQNFYIYYSSNDETIFSEHANPWENDSFEFYFDADNSKMDGAYDGVDDCQIRFSFHYTADDIAAWYNGADWDFSNEGCEMATMETELGWQAEVKIPLENLQIDPETGWQFGFECQNNDNDGENRESIGHFAYAGATYNNPSVWATGELSDFEIGESAIVPETATAPVIDGELDDVWKTLPVYSSNSYAYDTAALDFWDPSNAIDSWWEDHYYTFQLAYDAEKLYIFIDKFDDVIVDEHANPWEQDGVEFYFDGDYSQMETFDGIDDVQVRFNNWYTSSDDLTIGYGTGGNWELAAENIEFAGVETETGFTMEIAMPLADLGIEPENGYEFGFEIQSNDNDDEARDAERKWWSASNASWKDPSIWGTCELKAGAGSAVENEIAQVNSFELMQNYPNPFNPTTEIQYTLKQKGQTRLTVYNALGHNVAELVNEIQDAGNHSISFNASQLVSGIYFYQLETGNQVISKKMTLLK